MDGQSLTMSQGKRGGEDTRQATSWSLRELSDTTCAASSLARHDDRHMHMHDIGPRGRTLPPPLALAGQERTTLRRFS